VAPLSPDDVKRWDADAIHGVFQIATNRAATLQTLGDNLQQVHGTLSDWHGEAGDAFRADLGKARRDIEADGHESKQVAAAVSGAEADVRAVKAELDRIEQAADGYGFTITPDWRIDSGGMKLDGAKAVFKEQLQGLLDGCKLHAHSADQELAAAVRSAVGEAPVGAGAPQSPIGNQPKSLQDMLLPTGPGSGDAAKGPPVPGDAGAGKPPSLQDMLLGRGGPADQRPPPGSPLDLLSRIQPGATGIPAPPLKPAEIESFKALARQTMISDGVPPDQIEARLNAVVASTQQWLDAGAPKYIAPEGPRPPAPGFGEAFGDRWFSTEQGIKELFGQGGPGAPGVLESWNNMAKGADQVLENPLRLVTGEVKHAMDSPSAAYYLGEKAADGAFTLPTLLFGGEGAAARAGLGDMTGLDAAAGVTHDLPAVRPPLGPIEEPSPGFHSAALPHESPIPGGIHPSGPAPAGHGLPELLEPPAPGGQALSGPVEPSVSGSHPPISAGDTAAPPSDHFIPDGHYSAEPYAVDADGHYLPGSLPSYEQLQGITSTESDRAFYWSGRNAEGIGVGPDDSGIAELIADGSGGTTLEMTLAKNGVDPLPAWNRHDPVSVQFWEDASTSYAENAQGEVTAIVGSDLRPGNLWQTIEIPRLIENPDVARIVQIDPDTGVSTVIFDRGD
jgi:uncharacterized protein YukE